ncbi:hypothetical protein LF1_39490 [Rubripirellula obstinata]|uniref:Uncharacterized protein n=1 Tax=Rubripirellula obstinata TaxID=406547 RepID=A0A5B1CM43_9BACT|nr:hypothetical protein [Rubripirellula obstinata]KAA1261402.1 hypothetical protein LF1_39490 [Rubripirellula obstinata]
MSTTEPADTPPDLAGKDVLVGKDVGRIAGERPSQALQSLEQDLARLQRSIRMTIADKLNQFAGQSMGSIEENRKLVDAIARMLDSHGLRVQCSECGHPAILRISPRGSSNGVFVFDHTIEGRRTFHGGKNRMPEIRLVTKPARKKAGSGKPSNKLAS